MEKRLFFKTLRQCMLSNGFDKTTNYDFSKLSFDGSLKFVVRIPDGKRGFILGAQFPDYGEFTGTISKCMIKNYAFETLLVFPDTHDYSEQDIINSVEEVMSSIHSYLQHGKEQIKNQIDNWVYGVFSDKERNDILKYFGFPTVDLYSDEYMLTNIERIRRGGFILISLSEYTAHKDYYDKYLKNNCIIDVDSKYDTVMIHLTKYN